jgi:LacI family transcriptional regulator
VCWCDRRFLPPGVDTVRLDYVGGTFAATAHLLELGHRRIALCTSVAPDHQIAADQREGFRLALQNRNALAGGVVVPAQAFTDEAGRVAAADLLAHTPCPTAVICGSDDIARGLFAVLSAQRVRIPRDLSLVACNDTIRPGEWPVQPTTVALDFHRAGVLSARCLLARIRGTPWPENAAAGTDEVIPARLIVRGTTRQLRPARRTGRRGS